MKRKILMKKPVIGAFHAPNGNRHSVAIAGYYDITVQYKKKKNDTKYASKTTRYYVVNDGYHAATGTNSGRVQYISEKYLKALVKMD